MRFIIKTISITLFALLSTNVVATSLTPLWETSGFSAPESVCVSKNSNWLYVSNVNGSEPGFISRVTKDGNIDQLKWVEHLDMPTGMGLLDDKLYVVDNTYVHIINTKTAKIIQSLTSDGVKMLNDLAISKEGEIFVGDIATGTIYRIQNKKLTPWFSHKILPHTNGLLVQDDYLIAANLGAQLSQNLTKEQYGAVYKIHLRNKSITMIAGTEKLGGLDGIVEYKGKLLVTNFSDGELYQISDTQKILVKTLEISSADIGIDKKSKTLFVPYLFKGKVSAYTIKE